MQRMLDDESCSMYECGEASSQSFGRVNEDNGKRLRRNTAEASNESQRTRDSDFVTSAY